MKRFRWIGAVLFSLLFILWGLNASATPVDLISFTSTNGVTVDETSGTVLFTEDISYFAIYFFNRNFAVPADAKILAYDYELSLGANNNDWLITKIARQTKMEISENASGHFSIDLTPYRGRTVTLAFGLESNDYESGTTATISNVQLDPVPLPTSLILLISGLMALWGQKRRKSSLFMR